MTISDGLIIDHLPPWRALELLDLLRLKERAETVQLFLNQPGEGAARKDVILAERFRPDPADEQRIAILAPEAVLKVVEDGATRSSGSPPLPRLLEGVLLCANPNCITAAEEVPHKICVEGRDAYRCHYCRYRFSEQEIRFL